MADSRSVTEAIQPSAPLPQQAEISAILQAALNPAMDAEKVERMFALHERMLDRLAVKEFNDALAAFQDEVPQIIKAGAIFGSDKKVRSRYAKIEDIDEAVRPVAAKHGFSFSYDSEPSDGQLYTFTCKMKHRGGHSETNTITMPLDKGHGGRNPDQDVLSTASYARRLLLKMQLNIVESDEGDFGLEPISENQVLSLEELIVKTGANREQLLLWINTFQDLKKLGELKRKHYKKVIVALEEKLNARP